MKLNAEVEIGYIGEDGNLDEMIKNELIEHCVSVLEKDVIKELNNVIKELFISKIESKINDIFNDFLLNKPILITDSWGDKKQEYDNGIELLKAKFDNFINQTVDNDGKPILSGQCGFRNRHDSRIDYLIKQHLNFNFEKVKKDVQHTITTHIDTKIKDVKANMAKEILSNLYDKIDIEAGIRSKTNK